jgi:Tol biopolymer transport system component
VEGTPVKLIEGVLTDLNYATPQFDVSRSGLLAYAPQGRLSKAALVRVDLEGRRESLLEDRLIGYPRLSPDGRQVVFQGTEASRELDLWAYDLVTRRRSRLTHARGEETNPVFSPDGRSLVFGTWRETASISRMPLTGGPEEPLLLVPVAGILLARPCSFSPDGRWLALVSGSSERGISRIGVLDLQTEPLAPRWLLDTAFTQDQPVFSPRGGVLAYVSNQLGQRDVWVVAFSGDARTPVPVSREGGTAPFWSPDGRTLYYTVGSKLFAATVDAAEASRISEPRAILDATGLEAFAAAPDGRFLAVQRDDTPVTRIEIVLNWTEELRKRFSSAETAR